MNFLKKLFKGDDTIIGLSGFKEIKTHTKLPKTLINENLFNTFEYARVFETNFEKNALLL